MADQIEKVIATNGDTGIEPVPIATNDSPGIASFSKDDFLVDSQGKVEALTKWGIAHILNYRGANDVARMYDITTSFGKQLPKVGDVGLVLSDQVNPSVNDVDTQIGKIVRLTAIQTDATTPIVYYGENLGSIAGPQGIQGIQGPMGGIQLMSAESVGAGHLAITEFLDGSSINDSQLGKMCLVLQNGYFAYVNGAIVRITYESDIYASGGKQVREYDGVVVGNIRGAQGTKYIVAGGSKIDADTYEWTPVAASDVFVVGDYAICAQSHDSFQRGDIFKITRIVNGKARSTKQPAISVAQMQLGIYNLSDANIVDDKIVWKYSSAVNNVGTVPFIGSMGLCIDDGDTEHFGKIYIIEAVDESNGQVTTSLSGADLRGPVQELEIGDVTTVPNDETGAVGEATASLTRVDRLHNRLNLGIPVGPQGKQGIRGEIGPQGPAGVANIQSRGIYDPDATYGQNDVVFFPDEYTPLDKQGASYICTENNIKGKTPVSDPTIWGLFVTQGPEGKPGPVGPDGTNGVNGVFNALLGSVRKQPALGDNEITWDYVYVQPNSKGGDTLVAVLTEELSFSYGAVGRFTFPKGSIINVVNVAGTYARVEMNDALANNFVKGTISDSPRYVPITYPSAATEGNFTNAEFATLQASRENKIIFDNEIYALNDQGHDAGYNVYTHVGHNSQNRFAIKCITVNLNNKSWVLTEQSLGNNVVNLGNGSASGGNLIRAAWDILHENVDAVIELGDDVYRYAYSDARSTSGGALMRDVFVCVVPYDLVPGGVTITQASTKFVVCSGTGTGQYPYSWSRQAIEPPAKKKWLHRITFYYAPDTTNFASIVVNVISESSRLYSKSSVFSVPAVKMFGASGKIYVSRASYHDVMYIYSIDSTTLNVHCVGTNKNEEGIIAIPYGDINKITDDVTEL